MRMKCASDVVKTRTTLSQTWLASGDFALTMRCSYCFFRARKEIPAEETHSAARNKRPHTAGRKKFEESFLVVHSRGPKINPHVARAYELRIETCSSRIRAYARSRKYPTTPATPKFIYGSATAE